MASQSSEVTCPFCSRQYRWRDDYAGRKVKCKCGEKFRFPDSMEGGDPFAELQFATPATGPSAVGASVASATPPPAVPRNATTDTRRCRNCNTDVSTHAVICIHCGADPLTGKLREQTRVDSVPAQRDLTVLQLKLVGIGLAIHLAGLLMSTVGLLSLWASGVTANATLGVSHALIGMTVLAGLVVAFIGPLLCIAAPVDAGRYLAAVSGACMVVVVVLSFIWGSDTMQIFQLFGQVVAMGCFLAFLQKLALYMDHGEIYERTEFLLKTLFVLAITFATLFIPVLGCLTALVFLGAYVTFCIVYLILIGQTALATLHYHSDN